MLGFPARRWGGTGKLTRWIAPGRGLQGADSQDTLSSRPPLRPLRPSSRVPLPPAAASRARARAHAPRLPRCGGKALRLTASAAPGVCVASGEAAAAAAPSLRPPPPGQLGRQPCPPPQPRWPRRSLPLPTPHVASSRGGQTAGVQGSKPMLGVQVQWQPPPCSGAASGISPPLRLLARPHWHFLRCHLFACPAGKEIRFNLEHLLPCFPWGSLGSLLPHNDV